MQYAGVVISVVALVVSVFSLMERRRVDKRDLTLKLHETLVSPELQAGRRLLFNLEREVSQLSSEEYASANRALATLDVAGFYCDKGYVNEQDILDLWAPSLVKLKHKATPFLEQRDSERPGGIPVWPYYRKLVDRAEEDLRSRGITE
ncbi:hypothetical protein [Streptomyces sp. NBC_01187]|uniref:hypothetical protein n=1 Tax=Streptomyces sp. NBC_01187 TaxID=2903766 RepID=UPI00386B7188|nr:hypothetical protein OG220_16325 [Streptomyces sp. NBC_01187]